MPCTCDSHTNSNNSGGLPGCTDCSSDNPSSSVDSINVPPHTSSSEDSSGVGLVLPGIKKGSIRPSNKTIFAKATPGTLVENEYIVDLSEKVNREINYRLNFYRNYPSYSSTIEPNLRYTKITPIAGELVLSKMVQDMVDVLHAINFGVKPNFLEFSNKLKNIINNINYRFVILSDNTYLTFRNITSVTGTNSIIINFNDSTSGKKITSNLVNNPSVNFGILNVNTKTTEMFSNLIIESYTENSIVLKSTDFKTSGYRKGDLIQAELVNYMQDTLNIAETACVCNCNYCACNCNYCTCDCDYCTCNCNYCTCECNNCTCECNYCDCECNYCTCECNYTPPCNCDYCSCECNYTAPCSCNYTNPCTCECNYCSCECNYCSCECNYTAPCSDCGCNYCSCECDYWTCDCDYCTCEMVDRGDCPQNQEKW